MDQETNDVQLQHNRIDSKKFQINIKGTILIFLVIITVICSILGYNLYNQHQLKNLREQTNKFNKRLKDIESATIEDITVKHLDEKLDYVMSQQEVTVTSTQQMVEYMTFTFTVIGVFFLLVSGYFIYRQHGAERREEEGWGMAKDTIDLLSKSQQRFEKREQEGWLIAKDTLDLVTKSQQCFEKREQEGWVVAKNLLDLVTKSQQFVVQVQNDLRKHQQSQRKRRKRTEERLKKIIESINNRADFLITQFARDKIFTGNHFARLTNICNRIDNMRFQLQTFELRFNINCYFLKAVYEYIIGNYDTSKDEFDLIITKQKNKMLNQQQMKQLSLCYYYRGLIEYNIQENLSYTEELISLAIEKDPQIGGPDIKSRLLKAEIKFKRNDPEAYYEFKEITKILSSINVLNETQKRLLSYAYLGMANCEILKGGKKFLPSYYDAIHQINADVISEIITCLEKSKNSHIYTYLTLGQLSHIFEEANKNVGLKPSIDYFKETYKLIEENRPYDKKKETRGKILTYTVKLVCEKFLKISLEDTKIILKDLISDQELKTIYSIFSKVNVSKVEYQQELKDFGISGL